MVVKNRGIISTLHIFYLQGKWENVFTDTKGDDTSVGLNESLQSIPSYPQLCPSEFQQELTEVPPTQT